MAGPAIRGFKYRPAFGQDVGLVLNFQEGATQTFKAGEPVKLSSGKIVVAVASSTDLLLGFALSDASGVTDTLIPVQVIRPSDVFDCRIESDDTFTIANVGTAFEIKKEGSSNTWVVDQDGVTATDTAVWVLGSHEYGADGKAVLTAGGPIVVRFNPSNIEFSRDN